MRFGGGEETAERSIGIKVISREEAWLHSREYPWGWRESGESV